MKIRGIPTRASIRLRPLSIWISTAALCTALLVLAPPRGDAGDVAATVATLKDAKAECAYLRDLCTAARTAKREARDAMAESRANHERSRAMVGNGGDDDTQTDVRLQNRAVQDHLTATAQHRADAAARLDEARKLIAARHGRAPACGACPGI
ncbi:MAG TPA: hypothetical protein VGK30_00720 [Candidatus Binatia bacterium]